MCSTLRHLLLSHSSYLYSSITSCGTGRDLYRYASSASSSYILYVDMLVYINSSSLHTHTGRLAERPVWFSSVGLHLKRRHGEARNEGAGYHSLGRVGVTGVQAGLCGCRGAAVMASRQAVEGLCAPPQVL